MKKMHEIKGTFDRLTQSKPATVVLSIAFAILIWFTISVTLYPTTPKTFYNIPLKVELEGTQAGANGLSVVSYDVETVTVQIEGNRSKIGVLTEENLTAYAVVENVTGTGEFPLEIDVRSDANVSFEVKNVSPAHTNVTFDRIETRSFTVEPAFPNIVITPGHTLNEATCTPSTIEITGPTAQLDEIDRVVANSDKKEEIDGSYVLYTSDVILYNKENSLLDAEKLTIPVTNFKIDIPVLTQAELPLTYEIRNVPSNFGEENMKWLRERLKLSTETITLASNNAALANQENWHLGFIKLEEIGLNFSTTFNVPEKEGVINQSGLQQVTLTLDSEGLEEREFIVNADNVTVINKPSGYDFKVITKAVTITVIGLPEELDELSTADIELTVDLMNHNADQITSFSRDPLISFNNTNGVWASGVYKIALERVEKGTETD